MLPNSGPGFLISTCIHPLNLCKLHSSAPPCATLPHVPPPCAPPSAACCGDEMGHLQGLQCPLNSLLPLVLTSTDPQAKGLLSFQFFFSFSFFLDPF